MPEDLMFSSDDLRTAIQEVEKLPQMMRLIIGTLLTDAGGEIRLTHEQIGDSIAAEWRAFRDDEGMVVRIVGPQSLLARIASR